MRTAVALLLGAVAAFVEAGSNQPWMEKILNPQERAKALIAEMSIEEKLIMLHGIPNGKDGDVIYVGLVKGNHRLGIPELRLNDGPQGYRDDLYPRTTTAWPAALTVSNTWDVDLIQRWGEAMGDEFYRKGANIQLGPGLNLARVPLNGRNFEYLSGEDPYLGYTLAQPLIKGIQSQGVIANAKHWVENNQETDRSTVSANVDERTRHELYYLPFYGAVEAGVGSFMCSYNKINDVWACENPETLNTDLKGHLGFNGFVMSDWWATHSVSINEGLDQEMPTGYYFSDGLMEGIQNGTILMSKIDDSVKRILVPMFELGLFDTKNPNSHTSDVTTDAHSTLAKELSSASHVLLKNSKNLLPLSPSTPRRIALIGQSVRSPITAGGGSGRVIPKHIVSPYEGILSFLGITDENPVKADCSAAVQVNMTIGQDCWPSVPAIDIEDCANQCADDLNCRFYSFWKYDDDAAWCTLYPTDYKLQSAEGISTGSCVKNEPAPTWQCNQDKVCVATTDGSDLTVAAELAREADVAIVFISSFAHEGLDRESLSFEADLGGTCQFSAPGQDSLVSVVAGSRTPTVVAAVAPGAMLTPWRDEVDAILHGFIPGQEYGIAIAEVLFGVVNPSAKLTITLPKAENEVGFKPNEYPGVNLEADYSEQLLIGYRWYTAYNVKPAFAFGHGLSYTQFAYSDIVCESNKVFITVANIGSRPGAEVAQLYLRYPKEAGTPPLQLRGFHKTLMLEPEASQRIQFDIKQRDVSIWDVDTHSWMVVNGSFQAFVGSASDDLKQTCVFHT